MNNSQQLSTVTNSGIQSSTQDPQNSVQSSGLSAQSQTMQSSAVNTLLVSNGGIPLESSAIQEYDLGARYAATTTSASAQPTHHSPNYLLLGFSALFLIVALYLFWSTTHSAKNTTKK